MRPALTLRSTLSFVFLAVLVLLVLAPASPALQQYPAVDSGIFLYTGWRVAHGDLPYRDIWDHKPPLIYVINAVGIALTDSRWGVWALQVVSLFAAAGLSFRLFKRAFGTLAAVYASVAWLLNAFLTMDGGNYTTEYALPFQFALLLLFASAPASPPSIRRAFVMGMLSGVLFWLKQNDIGIPLAIALFMLLAGINPPARRASIRAIAGMGIGALLVTVIVLLPFVVQGAVAQFWDAVFLFNFIYIQETWIDRFVILRYTAVFLPALGLVVMSLFGWLCAALVFSSVMWRERRFGIRWEAAFAPLWAERANAGADALNHDQAVRLLALCVVALPFELVLVIISGNAFDHYFLALLPVLSVLAAFAFQLIITLLTRVPLERRLVTAFTAIFVLVLLFFAAEHIQGMLQRIVARKPPAVIATILDKTSANDTVYIWGGNTGVLFASHRLAPTRFVYLAPTHRREYRDENKALELLQALLTRPPRMIIVPAGVTPPFLEFPIPSPRIDAAVEQVRAAYHQTTTLDGWSIYEPTLAR